MATNWNLNEFLDKIEAIRAMGSLEQLVDQIPGLRGLIGGAEQADQSLDSIEAILRAMTSEERGDPQALLGPAGYAARRDIAQRAETSEEEVEGLLEQFQQVAEVLGQLGPGLSPRQVVDAARALLRDPALEPDTEEEELDVDIELEKDAPSSRAERYAARLDELLVKIQAGGGLDALDPVERTELDRISAFYRKKQRTA